MTATAPTETPMTSEFAAAAAAVPFGPEEFAAATHVSRETLARLITYARVLLQWQEKLNLIGASTVADLWRRHMWDSAQILDLVPGWRTATPPLTWLDLGSGAGFPAMVIALMGGGHVHLVEKSPRKCQFLRAVAAETAAPVTIHEGRAEMVSLAHVDIITARAFAPLPKLLALAQPFFGAHTVAYVHKGQHLDEELTEATKCWNMITSSVPSLTDPRGRILRVEGLRRV